MLPEQAYWYLITSNIRRVGIQGAFDFTALPGRILQFSFRGEKSMKKLAVFVFALLLAGSLSFAQATTAAPATDQAKTDTKAPEDAKKAHKGKKHKGSKKSKKGASTDTAATPK